MFLQERSITTCESCVGRHLDACSQVCVHVVQAKEIIRQAVASFNSPLSIGVNLQNTVSWKKLTKNAFESTSNYIYLPELRERERI